MKVFCKYITIIAVQLLLIKSICLAQEKVISLYPQGIKDNPVTNEAESHDTSRGILWIENVQEPTLEIFLPVKKNTTGKAIVICPGGGYKGLAYDWEGTAIAKWLNSIGTAAFVLKYRLPIADTNESSTTVPLADAQRAIRLVRHHAEEWNVSADQIGIMGFSAGGHLASTLTTHFDEQVDSNSPDLNAISARPDFAILIYPVITMNEDYTHKGSKKNLIGSQPSQQMITHFSNELQVTSDTPPTFLVHSTDDKSVPVKNSLLFYEALAKSGVPAEMHIYPQGGHGFALGIHGSYEQTWIHRLKDWLDNLMF
jgi:acetyl esterase/lipase